MSYFSLLIIILLWSISLLIQLFYLLCASVTGKFRVKPRSKRPVIDPSFLVRPGSVPFPVPSLLCFSALLR